MGRHKLADLRALAEQRGWLDTQAPLPEDAEIAAALGASKLAASTVSTLESHRERIAGWLDQGVNGKTILAALHRNHDYKGSYSSVYRMIVAIRGERPPDVTVPLSFAPGEAAQVDFGAGPMLMHPAAAVARGATTEGPGWLGHGQGDRLQPQALAGAHALHRRWRSAGGQQLGGKPDSSDCNRKIELALRWVAPGRPACRGDHEPDPVGQAQWARATRISQ